MDKKLEDALTQLKTSEFLLPDTVKELNEAGRALKETAPHDALSVFRRLAMAVDQRRMYTDAEKLHFFQEASDLGWKLKEPVWLIDMRTAQLLRTQGNCDNAGHTFELAAASFLIEGERAKIANQHDWNVQFHMLREARMCFESAGASQSASRCFVKGMKLIRDNTSGRMGRFKEWVSYIFWTWGESPLRVAAWGAAWIAVFALCFSLIGITTAGGTRHDISAAIYFSVVTFTTLGYGDFTAATDLGRYLAAAEALSGVFFTGLFLVTFVKKFSR